MHISVKILNGQECTVAVSWNYKIKIITAERSFNSKLKFSYYYFFLSRLVFLRAIKIASMNISSLSLDWNGSAFPFLPEKTNGSFCLFIVYLIDFYRLTKDSWLLWPVYVCVRESEVEKDIRTFNKPN